MAIQTKKITKGFCVCVSKDGTRVNDLEAPPYTVTFDDTIYEVVEDDDEEKAQVKVDEMQTRYSWGKRLSLKDVREAKEAELGLPPGQLKRPEHSFR